MQIQEAISNTIQAVRDDAARLEAILSERESPNFEIDDLRQLGINPVQVELSEEDQVFKFESCFFWPEIPSLLSDYPWREDDEDNKMLVGSEHGPDSLDWGWGSDDSDAGLEDDVMDVAREVGVEFGVIRDGFDDGPGALHEFSVLRGTEIHNYDIREISP